MVSLSPYPFSILIIVFLLQLEYLYLEQFILMSAQYSLFFKFTWLQNIALVIVQDNTGVTFLL